MLVPYENIFHELFQTWNPFHNVMALWSHHLIIFPFTQQNENEIAYEPKANEKLIQKKEAILNCFQSENKQATNKFSNVQNHKKSYSKTTFRIILLFR